ncbi:MAG: FecR domain-containing protein [Bacteroidales bacterium]|nr:FecR domain-containing protein [Bacteroidales bacterium]
MDFTAPGKDELRSYISGKCDTAGSRNIERWFYHNGKSEEATRLLYSVWNDMAPADSPTETGNVHRAFKEFRRRIELSVASRNRKWKRIAYRSAAAILLPLCIMSIYLYERHTAEEGIGWTGRYVAYGNTDSLTMPDGSKVWLNSGSRIIYPEKFSGKYRLVYLDGEGVFDVMQDKSKPMVVKTGNASVKVLGTRFNLKAYPEERTTEVSLLEGRVEFSVSDSAGVYSLLPGETVTYDRESESVHRSRFVLSDYNSWKDGKFYFKNQTLEYIARQLERTFDVTIIIKSTELRRTRYHMAFVNDESIDEILHYIDLYDNISVVRTGDVVEIRQDMI